MNIPFHMHATFIIIMFKFGMLNKNKTGNDNAQASHVIFFLNPVQFC